MTILIQENLRTGGDPSGCAEFVALGEELAKLNHPACPDVNWPRVEQLSINLFREHGVELQSTAAFVLARAQLHGLDGMGDGLCLLNRLLIQEWERLWPPALPVRLEILAWLFTQMQPLLRRQEPSVAQLPVLCGLDDELSKLSDRLEEQGQVPLMPLQALRKQLHGAMQRLGRDSIPTVEATVPMQESADEVNPALCKPVGAKGRSRPGTSPAVVVLKLDAAEPRPSAASERKGRTLWPWLLVLLILLSLTGLFWWWTGASPAAAISRTLLAPALPATLTSVPLAAAEPIRLDNLVLFPPGRAELKPESTKVLINSLISIKAQPGWLIVITGHSDTSGNPERNLQLSRERAAAVKGWMQMMGDIPDGCFVVQGRGASQPIAGNDTESGRRANRRVDIQLVPSAGACVLPVH